jgi:hypothetical protein
MTVCKTLNLFQKPKPETGAYRKKDVAADLQPSEFQAAQYYDPAVNVLCSFFNENDAEYENVHSGNDFRFKRRGGGPMGFVIPAWELAARRCVFYHRAAQNDGDYDFLGFSNGVQSVLHGPDEWLVFSLQ